jgi:N-acetylglucosamine-6-phosphate deacetylase
VVRSEGTVTARMATQQPREVSARSVVGVAGGSAPGVVTFSEGLITQVRPLGKGLAEFEILAPGFIDLQFNGCSSTDVATADGSDWDQIAANLSSHGVTTWCPTLVTASDDDIAAAIARIRSSATHEAASMPRIAGVHLEGPYISVLGAHRAEHARNSVDPSFAENLDPSVRIVTLAPEIRGATDAIAALRRRGVVVSLGHSACTAEQAHAAADAGASLVTHLGNAMGGFHHRSPGLLGAALADERLRVGLIADLEHVHHDVIRMAFAAKGPDGVVLVTDSVAVSAGTVGPVELEPHGGGAAAARLRDGTLAGSALTMDRAVSNCVVAAGVRLEDAVRSASTTPARALGLSDRGEIAPGLRADLVALAWEDRSKTLRVEAVWTGGVLSWLAPGESVC